MLGPRPWSLPSRPMERMTDTPEMDTITLILHNSPVPSITVSRFDAVGTLQTELQMPNAYFVCDGRILSPAFSFEYLGVKDGSEVHVVPQTPEKVVKSQTKPAISSDVLNRIQDRFNTQWACRFKDPEAALKQLHDAVDPATATESARLTDVFRMRVECNQKAYRKVCFRYNCVNATPRIRCQSLPTVVPTKADEPSSNFLPCAWMGSPSARPQKSVTLLNES